MMSNKQVVIVPTGVANLASVNVGLRRVGAEPRLARDAEDVVRAQAVVLPGVGAFAAGMRALRRQGYAEALRTRIDAGRPTLAICLGL
jgi:imidazole glycerol-phosphate synthase subunit HisH